MTKLDIIGVDWGKEALLSFPQIENCTLHIRHLKHRQFDRWAQLRVSSSDWVRQLHTILCLNQLPEDAQHYSGHVGTVAASA